MVDFRSTKNRKETVDEFDHVKNLLSEKEAALSAKEAALGDMQKKYDELLDAAKHIAADFDNFQKRTEAEKEKLTNTATKGMILRLLPILDQFGLCVQHSANTEEFTKSIELIYSQFRSLLEEEGVQPIRALHEQFDPHVHEAIMYIPSEKENNIIVEEIQTGYFLHDMLLRASKVKVAKQTLEG